MTDARTDVGRFLEEVRFPVTRDELVELAGDRRVRLGHAKLRLRTALNALPEERFATRADLVRALQETVPDEASLL